MTEQQATEGNGSVNRWRVKGPGGTSGGLGSFLVGAGLFIAGAYLIMNQVQITSGYWQFWGGHTFGLTLVPLIIGIGLLFFNGTSLPGWILCGAGIIIIFAGILVNLHMYYRQTTLYEFLLMAGMFAGGLGLMARSLRGL